MGFMAPRPMQTTFKPSKDIDQEYDAMASSTLPPTDPDQLAIRYPGFSSFKTQQSIHYRHRWLRDALIQASLDPHTIELAPSSTAEQDLPAGIEFAFRRRTAAGLGIVLVTQIGKDLEGLIDDERVTVVTRIELSREPIFTAARTIWGQKRLAVDGAERYRAIDAVESRGSALMHQVVDALRDDSVDPIHQVCSLIANCYLTVDLRSPIGPGSVLTLGPASNGSRRASHWRVDKP